MPYELKLSSNGTFVTFRPNVMGKTLDDSVERIGALGDFADHHGTSKILFDFRNGLAPIDAELYDAAFASPHLKVKGKWRVALITSFAAPSYNARVIEVASAFLDGLGQTAKHFYDYDEAVAWLTDA